MRIVPSVTVDAQAVEALLDRAFGAERHGRTAYRIRAGMPGIAELGFAAIDAGDVIGTIQCWPIRHVADDGAEVPLVMVGPVAVLPERQRDGVGRALMTRALAAAAETGQDDALMLIGDPEYYGRFFGFTAAATGAWRLPGPVERRRLLARGDRLPHGAGTLGARVVAPA